MYSIALALCSLSLRLALLVRSMHAHDCAWGKLYETARKEYQESWVKIMEQQ